MNDLKKSLKTYNNAQKLIPGGTQLLSKRPEMFLPGGWPSYYETAKGIEITDLDGNVYKDFSIGGVGSTILGYADPDVNQAVKKAIDSGSMSTLNSYEEVSLAEELIRIHPWAGSARFARGGGEAMAVAIRIARAYTGKDIIAFCGYHGWHDWYLSANLTADSALDGHLLPGLAPTGVPRGLEGSVKPFYYNDIDSLKKIVTTQNRKIAAIVMEPARDSLPTKGFLSKVRELANQNGIILIYDEVTSGFRINHGGLHLELDIDPDLAIFAKGLGNGYPISAIIGEKSIMDAAQNSFISSTSWTERVGPVAALATLKKHRETNVASHLIRIGKLTKKAWRSASIESGVSITISGLDPLAKLKFDQDESSLQRTYFTQEMLKLGFLAGGSFYAMGAHTEEDVMEYRKACTTVFLKISDGLANNTLKSQLKGPIAHSGFKRLT